MKNTRVAVFSTAAVVAALVIVGSAAQPSGDALEQGFRNPPDSARPRTWWHWTGGNVTKEGITKDLEWMKRAGIAGFQLADVAFGAGQTVEHKIEFGSPEWYDAVRHAAAEAQRLGLEMAIFSSPGWSETGGPWVKPEQAMKKLVWSETDVQGPRRFTGKLPQPPSVNGPIRNLTRGPGRAGEAPDPTYYGDSAVVAYRTPADEVSVAEFHPKLTTSTGAADTSALLDDDLNSAVTIPAPADGRAAWVQFEFAQPFNARVDHAGRPRGHSLRPRAGRRRRHEFPDPGGAARRAALSRRHGADLRLPGDGGEILSRRIERRADDAGRGDVAAAAEAS